MIDCAPCTGTAGKLQLRLVDTAANTGTGQPLASASVSLDMRQWKDSQTYQAEVPLVAVGVLTTLYLLSTVVAQWSLLCFKCLFASCFAIARVNLFNMLDF